MSERDEREVDEDGKLWGEIRDLLHSLTPFRPRPAVKPASGLGSGKNGLRLSPLLRKGLSRNWNQLIVDHQTGRTRITNDEAGELKTAADVWLRIAPL